MNILTEVTKYKSKAINALIIIAALIITVNVYRGFSVKAEDLKVRIADEEKKKAELVKINQASKKVNAYKKLLAKREAILVMSDLNGIAKSAKVQVSSIKPSRTEANPDYTKYIFEVNIDAADYASLSKFIREVEFYNNVYIIESASISFQGESGKESLKANLTISSVSVTG